MEKTVSNGSDENLKLKRKDTPKWINVTIFTITAVIILSIVVFTFFKIRKHKSIFVENFFGRSMDWKKGSYYNPLLQVSEHQKRKMRKTFFSTSKMTIRVLISSYRDAELCNTLNDMWLQAAYKERIHFCVVQQNDVNDSILCFGENSVVPKSRLKIMNISYLEAKGPTWARHLCETLSSESDWSFMTDSHMRFEYGWDGQLIENIFQCPRPLQSLITIYPDGYYRKEEASKPGWVNYRVDNRKNTRLEVMKGFRDDGGHWDLSSNELVSHDKRWTDLRALNADHFPEFYSINTFFKSHHHPKLVPMYSGNFCFGATELFDKVPYSPHTPHIYLGEEFFMAIRMWTHGVDLYGPKKAIGYHLWENNNYRHVYDGDLDVELVRLQSAEYIRNVVTGVIQDEKYGMGSERDFKGFMDYLGIDWDSKSFIRPRSPWKEC